MAGLPDCSLRHAARSGVLRPHKPLWHNIAGQCSESGWPELERSGRAHSAVADAVMTAGDIAEYWRELQCEMNEDAGSESA
ncbi:hypothetical protein CE665_21505 [Salmonella enterica subsp. enterica serovar Poona]|nr:hypothetical protein [Salmonella enterica subsp. enterica serovar Poona]